MGRERCPDWQIDYIISVLDEDHNCKIDLGEFLENFYIINHAISQNPYLERKASKGNKKVFMFSKALNESKKQQIENTNVDEVQNFTNFAREILNERKTKINPTGNLYRDPVEQKIDDINSQ